MWSRTLLVCHASSQDGNTGPPLCGVFVTSAKVLYIQFLSSLLSPCMAFSQAWAQGAGEAPLVMCQGVRLHTTMTEYKGGVQLESMSCTSPGVCVALSQPPGPTARACDITALTSPGSVKIHGESPVKNRVAFVQSKLRSLQQHSLNGNLT